LFSLFAFLDGARQRCSFLIQLIRGKRSTRKSDFGVFTQPGSIASFSRCTQEVRFTPDNGHASGRVISVAKVGGPTPDHPHLDVPTYRA
jgi:hypothetical protein